jgi:biopolymer transport protein ExbD
VQTEGVALLKVTLKPNDALADKEAVYSKLAEVMAAVQHAGFSKLAFVTLEQ